MAYPEELLKSAQSQLINYARKPIKLQFLKQRACMLTSIKLLFFLLSSVVQKCLHRIVKLKLIWEELCV